MVAFIVASLVLLRPRADASRAGARLAAACALLAFFTKAAAAFFVAALGARRAACVPRRGPTAADVACRHARAGRSRRSPASPSAASSRWRCSSLPNWTDYRFYNWQMSVTRKPSYDLQSLIDRVTWFPIVHDIFTRMWFVVVVGVARRRRRRWRAGARRRRPSGCSCSGSRLGALELLLHDVGNERRFVFFIPALVALDGARARARPALLPAERRDGPARDARCSRCRSCSTAPMS